MQLNERTTRPATVSSAIIVHPTKLHTPEEVCDDWPDATNGGKRRQQKTLSIEPATAWRLAQRFPSVSAEDAYQEGRRGGVSTARRDAWEGSGATLGLPAGWAMQARHGASKGSRVIWKGPGIVGLAAVHGRKKGHRVGWPVEVAWSGPAYPGWASARRWAAISK